MKAVIPLAGLGSRLKPHTFTTPKPLMEVAGKAIIDYVIADVLTLEPTEMIFIVGYKKQTIMDYILAKYPNIKCKFVEQKVRDGDGSAVRLGLASIEEDEDVYVVFGADTLIDFNLKKSLDAVKTADAVVFGKEVENPSHYGIMNVRSTGEIYEVEEKPVIPKSNLAIIGAYYFKSALLVKSILDDFFNKKITIKGEYKIVQVLDRYIEMKDTSIQACKVSEYFDCGRPEVLITANRYFLEKYSNGGIKTKGNSIIISPSYVSETAELNSAIIGPYASIGDGVRITNSIVQNSIVNKESIIENIVLKDSLIGKEVFLHGKTSKINIGDKSEIMYK